MTTSVIDAFGLAARDYVSGRPGYPDALLADLPPAEVVVELGAGTGKFTGLLARSGAKRVIAVEPQPAMAAHIPAAANVEVVIGTAEQIPLPSASADLGCSATAFHWFDYPKATAEMLRVVRPGGYVALVWNVRDARVPWVAAINRLTEAYRTGAQPREDERRILGDDRFELVREAEHRFAHRMPRSGILGRVFSSSYIAALPAAEQDNVRREVQAIIAADPGLAGADEIGFPYVCRLYLLRCRA